MSILRTIIVFGQVGRIWATTKLRKQLFQTVSVVGTFYLLSNNDIPSETQVFTLGNNKAKIQKPKEKFKLINFKKRPF